MPSTSTSQQVLEVFGSHPRYLFKRFAAGGPLDDDDKVLWRFQAEM